MRGLLLAAVSLACLSSAAEAQDVVMRRPIPVQATSGSSGQDGPMTGPAYGLYSQCYGAERNDACYSFEGGSVVAIVDAGLCATAQGSAYAAEVATVSRSILGDPARITPAGAAPYPLSCVAPSDPTPAPAINGAAYGTYSACSDTGQQDVCLAFENGAFSNVDDAGLCGVEQDQDHRDVVTRTSQSTFGRPDMFTFAGAPNPDLHCVIPEVVIGHGWSCEDDGAEIRMRCLTVNKSTTYAYDMGDVAGCGVANGQGYEAVLGAYGLNAPPYDGSCVRPLYGWSRGCGFTGPVGTNQSVNYIGGCFGLNPVSGLVSAEPAYQCQTNRGYSADQLAKLATANLDAGGSPSAQSGADGQPCAVVGQYSILRQQQSDVTTTTPPDLNGSCTGTRALTFQVVCRSASTISNDLSRCSRELALWQQDIDASVPEGGSVSKDETRDVNGQGAFVRDLSFTYPATCG